MVMQPSWQSWELSQGSPEQSHSTTPPRDNSRVTKTWVSTLEFLWAPGGEGREQLLLDATDGTNILRALAQGGFSCRARAVSVRLSTVSFISLHGSRQTEITKGRALTGVAGTSQLGRKDDCRRFGARACNGDELPRGSSGWFVLGTLQHSLYQQSS